VDPIAPSADAPTRAFRGGSFNRAAVLARSAYRDYATPETQAYNLGLRPARALTLDPPPLPPE
jgi:formylglycine-generating enzyme required for sulfatase activity